MQQPISLYLDLEPDTKPDLAAAARAALAFDAAVKEVAFILDPSIQVRLELESGTEGSLKLNSVIKSVVAKADRKMLGTIAFTIVAWFASDLRSLVTQHYLQDVIFEDDKQQFTPEEIAEIADQVAKALKNDVGEEQVQRVFRELQNDSRIRGVGVTTNPDKKPRVIVPRSEFGERSGTTTDGPSLLTHRVSRTDETITLISPVLVAGNRRWKFSLGGHEFGAAVKDQDFLDDVLAGRERIPMIEGLTLGVLLETKEEDRDGVWVITERNVLKVFGVTPAPRQTSFLSPDKE